MKEISKTLSLGIFNHNNNNLEVAKDYYKKILDVNPEHFQTNYLLGNLYAQLKDFHNAKKFFQIALNIKPSDKGLLNNLGNVFRELGNNLKAIEYYKKVIKIDPNYAETLNNLGVSYSKTESFNKSITLYKKAIVADPNCVPALNNLGLIYLKQGKNDKSKKLFLKALKTNPMDINSNLNLANLFKYKGEYKKAIDLNWKIIKIDPNFIKSYNNIISIYKLQKKYDEGLSIAFQTLEKKTYNSNTLNLIGSIYFQLKKFDLANKYFKKTLDSNNILIRTISEKFLGIINTKPLPKNDNVNYLKEFYQSGVKYGWAENEKNYFGRKIIKNQICSYFKNYKKKTILDLGCGSGGFGKFLKKYSKTLDGVDILNDFLNFAKKKNVYTNLIHMDCVKYISVNKNKYDLIVAAAVLLHFSDLEDLFNKIYNSLKKEGYFIFSTFFNDEISIDVDDSGNFKHSHGYISKISNNCNFKICKYSVNVHEINYGAKKKARVYILKK